MKITTYVYNYTLRPYHFTLPIVGTALPLLVQAIYDFTPQESGELEFRRGDVITVTDNTDQHWWEGELCARRGLFPATYVTPLYT